MHSGSSLSLAHLHVNGVAPGKSVFEPTTTVTIEKTYYSNDSVVHVYVYVPKTLQTTVVVIFILIFARNIYLVPGFPPSVPCFITV